MKDYTILVPEDIATVAVENGFKPTHCSYDYPVQLRINSFSYYVPTAEQICGWIEDELDFFINVTPIIVGDLHVEWTVEIIDLAGDEIGRGRADDLNELLVTKRFDSSSSALIEGIKRTLEDLI